MDKLKAMVADVKSGWEKIDKKKQITLISIVASITIVLFMLIYFVQRTEYKVLFSELEEADAGAIVEDLESKGMEYKLENNGSTILIDKNKVDNYRIELAVDGPMPTTSTGFEIFDSTSMMATDEDRAIMYQRALSGELERSISSLQQVKASKVLLNLPESSVFQNPNFQKEATASVILEMNNNQMPNQATIQGIAALVSGAVENLPQGNVEIVDTTGRLLSTSVGDSYTLNTDIVSEHQRIKNMIERDLEQKVITLLAPVYGIESVQVSVNTDLNFDAIEREIVEYGDEGSIRSQTESVSGSAALAGQVQSSLEDNTVIEFDETEEDDQSSYEHATNYELNTTSSRIVEAPGAIERMTASVIILDNPRDRAAVQTLVENAIGANRDRNNDFTDSVEIEYFPLTAETNEPIVIGNNELFAVVLDFVQDYWVYLLIGLIVIILILLILRVIRKQRAQEEEEELEMAFPEIISPLAELDEIEIDKEAEEKILKNQMANEKEDMIREQTKSNPELAAELIKIWLKED